MQTGHLLICVAGGGGYDPFAKCAEWLGTQETRIMATIGVLLFTAVAASRFLQLRPMTTMLCMDRWRCNGGRANMKSNRDLIKSVFMGIALRRYYAIPGFVKSRL